MNENACWVSAIALQRHMARGALINLAGDTMWYCEEPVVSETEVVCEHLARRLLARATAQGRPVVGLGIGCTSDIDVDYSTMQRMCIPISTEEWARAAALGEAWFGAGAKARSLAYISTDQPMAIGMVVERKPYRGAHGMAGCIPRLRGEFVLTEVQAAVNQGGGIADDVLRYIATPVAEMVALTVAMYDPELVVVGGKLAETCPHLPSILLELGSLQGIARSGRVDIRSSHFQGNAALIGAACLVLEEFLTDPLRLLADAKALSDKSYVEGADVSDF